MFIKEFGRKSFKSESGLAPIFGRERFLMGFTSLNRCNRRLSGFTLIELLIVIAIIAVLAVFAFVALDPKARFEDARNAQRWTDTKSIIEAMRLYQIDYKYPIPEITEAGITPDLYYQIGTASSGCNDICSNPTVVLQASCFDFAPFLVNSGKLASIPVDPGDSNASSEETRYYFIYHSDGKMTVGSCSEELGSNSSIPDISVTR